jgi:hypothetical protein
MLAEPTSIQRDAFDLIGVPIPLTFSGQTGESKTTSGRSKRYSATPSSSRQKPPDPYRP